MKSYWRKLSAFLVIVLIIATMAVPTMGAATTVSGGTSKANATTLSVRKTYIYNLKSSTSVAYFKFKTPKYYAFSNIGVYTPDATAPKNIKVIFKKANNATIEESDSFYDSYYTTYRSLTPNTWYYFILKNPKHSSGKFELYVSCYKDEDKNNKATAKKIVNEKTYNCTLVPGVYDRDYYKFVPTKTGKYRIIVKANDELSSSEYFVAYFFNQDGSGVVRKVLKKNGAALVTDRNLKKGKTYYIKVAGSSDSFFIGFDGDGKYKIRISKK